MTGPGPGDDARVPAADNNASWCDTICRLHGLEVHRDSRLWWTADRSPDLYPDAVILAPGVSPEEVLGRVDLAPGCSVKDSYADLDLSAAGFEVLFEAQWVSCGPASVTSTELSWRPVRDESDLARWVAAHGEATALLPQVLAQPGIRLFLSEEAGRIVGGVVLNAGGGVVGVSNLFGGGGDAALLWSDVPALAAATFPGLPLVGYESGEDLAAAATAGFSARGPLRVWILRGVRSGGLPGRDPRASPR